MYPGNSAGFYAQSAYNDEVMSINSEKDGDASDVGLYADLISEKLISDYYDTVLSVGEIASVLERYAITDCDLAAKILGAIHGNYSSVKDTDEFMSILKLVCENPKENAQAIAENALGYVTSSDTVSSLEKRFSIYRYLYPKLSAPSCEKLMMTYMETVLKNGKESVYDTFKSNCPCKWQDAVAMLSGESFLRRILSFDSQETGLFAALVILDMYTLANKDEQKQMLHYVTGIYGELVKVHDEARFDKILKKADSISSELSANVFVSVISGDMEYFHNDVKYLFSYLERLVTSGGAFWTVLTKVVTIYPDCYLRCAKEYMELEGRHPEAVVKLGAFASRSAEIKDFVDCTRICRYETEPVKSREQLMDDYRRLVCAEYSNPDYAERVAAVFRSKVASYLDEKNAKNRIREAMFFFDGIFRNSADCRDVKLFLAVCDGIFKEQTMDSIAKCGVIDVRTMIGIHDVSKRLGAKIDPKAEFYIISGYLAHSARGDKNSFGVISGLIGQGAIENLMRSSDSKTACEFVSISLDNALRTVYTVFEMGTNGPFVPIFEPLIKPFALGSNFVSEYVRSLKSDQRTAQKYIGYLLDYIFTSTSDLKPALENVARSYFDSIGKAKRNEVFDILRKTENNGIQDKGTLDRYIKHYEQNHISFWRRLFGGKKKGD